MNMFICSLKRKQRTGEDSQQQNEEEGNIMKRVYEETENEGKQEEKSGYNKNIIE